jgi:uncharacterized protein (TIGR02147 family)
MKSIYQFSDFREYLRAFYAFKKSASSGFTFRRFSEAAEIKSPNYLKLVMDGHRELSQKHIHCFAKALELTFDETQYFEALVHFGQTEEQQEGAYYSNRLRKLKKTKPGRAVKLSRAPEILSQWYTPAVLVCLEDQKIQEAPSWVSKMTGISVEEARKTIQTLRTTGVVAESAGSYRLNHHYFDLRDTKARDAVHERYLQQQLALSQKVFQKRYRQGAKFSSHTFTIAKTRFADYEDRINQFIQELTTLTNKDPVEEVVQLNFQMFRLPE